MGVQFGKFVHTQNGKIIMSILLGFGLASLFRKVCNGNGCLQFYASPLEEIKEKIYKGDDKKCITFKPMYSKCNLNMKTVNFE
jgi:hypothetical protein